MVSWTIENTYDYKFEEAVRTTDKLIAAYPDEPVGYLYKCGVIWKMLEEDCAGPTDSAYSEIKHLIDSACGLSKTYVGKNPSDVMGLFYYAGGLVYRARYGAIKHDWFSVMSDGVKSRKLLQKILELDPNFYDAYSGIGAFNYYASNIPWYLKPIAYVLGVSGNGAEGLAQLRKAAEYGKYSKTEAAEFLATVVYVNEDDYSGAKEIMRILHDEYPLNLDFTRSLCWDLYKLHDYAPIIGYADSALSLYASNDGCHGRNIGYLLFLRANALSDLNRDYAEALNDYTKMIGIAVPKFLVRWSYLGRGELFLKLNRVADAISDFETAADINGDSYTFARARTALDTLRRK